MTVPTAEAHLQRGRIVRALERYGGTANVDDYLNALADAGEFNTRHPTIAIPKAFKVLGYYPKVCEHCLGEGVRSDGVRAAITMASCAVEINATLCWSCQGAGFEGLTGYGAAAKVKVAAPDTMPR